MKSALWTIFYMVLTVLYGYLSLKSLSLNQTLIAYFDYAFLIVCFASSLLWLRRFLKEATSPVVNILAKDGENKND